MILYQQVLNWKLSKKDTHESESHLKIENSHLHYLSL